MQDVLVTEVTGYHGDKRSARKSVTVCYRNAFSCLLKGDQKLSCCCAYLADRVVVSRPLVYSGSEHSVSRPSEAPVASLPTRRLLRENVATSNLTSAMRRLVIPRACAVICD
jgi:hypothetical protein